MMRRRRDHRVAVLATLLVTGGWVCQSAADDPCPGGLTCAVDVATQCCPFGSSTWCGQCTTDDSGCTETSYSCTDRSRVLDCSFDATITAATCTNPTSADGTVSWNIDAMGTLDGCGQEVALIDVQSKVVTAIDCGSWEPGVFGGCVPTGDAMTSTTWRTASTISLPDNQTAQAITVGVRRGHGPSPELASMVLSCGP